MATVTEVLSTKYFQEFVLQNELVMVFFWAAWSEPCKSLNDIVAELAKANPALKCAKVEAEAIPEVSGHLAVTAVPTVVFLQKGDEVDRLEGFDPAALYEKASAHAARKGQPVLPSRPSAAGTAPAAAPPSDAQARIRELLARHDVLLFMKGSPDAPRCGFSRRVVDALRSVGTPFQHFDILQDEEIRQGVKVYSDWPTYPQVFVKGEMIGGCDIIEELHKTGELKATIDEEMGRSAGEPEQRQEAPAAAPPPDAQARIRELLARHDVLLFMKGSPDAPRCGFSRRVVDALRSIGTPFQHFDILEDEEIRQGVKVYSDWPTYPQVFVKGEMIGGCDIIEELHKTGELKATIDEEMSKAAA